MMVEEEFKAWLGSCDVSWVAGGWVGWVGFQEVKMGDLLLCLGWFRLAWGGGGGGGGGGRGGGVKASTDAEGFVVLC
ncbi:hypothetical protein VTJ04DRAFT_2043 [Mycothermus thermophilus]|uniref:uncharacterized protein n=1 Tax=Humicola insolens TaxID=85995 RepID=UPI003744745D